MNIRKRCRTRRFLAGWGIVCLVGFAATVQALPRLQMPAVTTAEQTVSVAVQLAPGETPVVALQVDVQFDAGDAQGGLAFTGAVAAAAGNAVFAREVAPGTVRVVVAPRADLAPLSAGEVAVLNFTYLGAANRTLSLSEVVLSDARPAALASVTTQAGQVARAETGLDSDGDSLPDDWETQHFGQLARDGNADFDLDGLSDSEEYLAGSDPRVADGVQSLSGHSYVATQTFGAGNIEYPQDVAVDLWGNRYVAGYFYGTVDFDPGAGEAVGTSGGSGNSAFVTKFNADGTYAWTWLPKIDESSGWSWASAVAVNGAGEVYISGGAGGTVGFGRFITPQGEMDDGVRQPANGANLGSIFLTKLNADGVPEWTRLIGGPQGGGEGFDVAVAADGTVYLTGRFGGTTVFNHDDPQASPVSAGQPAADAHGIFLTQYLADGRYGWTRFIAPAAANSGAHSYAVTTQGDAVYVAGQFFGDADIDGSGVLTSRRLLGYDGVIAQWDRQGRPGGHWQLRGLSDQSSVWPTDVAAGHDGSLYVGGAFKQAADFDPAAAEHRLAPHQTPDEWHGFVLKLAPGGALAWVNSVGNTQPGGSASTFGHALWLTESQVYLGGTFSGETDFAPGDVQALRNSGQAYAPFVAAYDLAGGYGSAWTAVGAWGDNDSNEPWRGGGVYGLGGDAQRLYVTGYYYGALNFNPQGVAEVLSSSSMPAGGSASHDAFVMALTLPGGE